MRGRANESMTGGVNVLVAWTCHRTWHLPRHQQHGHHRQAGVECAPEVGAAAAAPWLVDDDTWPSLHAVRSEGSSLGDPAAVLAAVGASLSAVSADGDALLRWALGAVPSSMSTMAPCAVLAWSRLCAAHATRAEHRLPCLNCGQKYTSSLPSAIRRPFTFLRVIVQRKPRVHARCGVGRAARDSCD